MSEPKNIIGVFDSGLGGLAILKYFLKELPEYNYFYLGDNARLPYGEKSTETIYQYSKEAVNYLFSVGCNLIIIACNTASAQALRRLQREYLPITWPDRRLLGVIRPLSEYLAYSAESNLKNKQWKSVGIIGTKATIESGTYEKELKNLNPRLKVLSKSTPLLVPLIESGWLKEPETKMILKKYLKTLKNKKVDILLPACTHYDGLLKPIREIMGQKTFVPKTGKIIAASLKDYLHRHPELLLKPSSQAKRYYAVTDLNQNFQKSAAIFLGRPLKKLKKVKLVKS